MKRSRHDFVRIFKLNSIFVRIFAAFIIIMGFLLGAFYVFAANNISKNYMDRIDVSNANMLRNNGASVDITFINLTHTMRQVLQNQYCIRAMIIPSLQNIERSMDVIGQLQSAVSGNTLVKGAALYVPAQKHVFSSEGSVSPVERSAWIAAISAYESRFPGALLSDGGPTTQVKIIGGRIFLYQDYYPPNIKNIGTLIFEIDPANLYTLIFGNISEPGNPIFLFDANDRPVFSSVLDYNPASGISLPSGENSGSFSLQTPDGVKNICYYNRSESGWQYMHLVDAKVLRPDSSGALPAILPFLGVAVLAILPLSLYITNRIYRPVRRLMELISHAEADLPAGADRKAKDEMDYFSLAYTEALDNNERLRSIITGIYPAVVERLLMNLILGREVHPQDLEKAVTWPGVSFFSSARYSVMLISISDGGEAGIPEMEMNLYLAAIRSLTESEFGEDICCQLLRTGDAVLALVLGFGEPVSALSAKQALNGLHERIRRMSANLTYSIAFGRSDLYNHIEDIRFAFLEAREDLYRVQFYGEESPESASLEHMAAFTGVYFKKKCAQIRRGLEEYDCRHAMELLRHTISFFFTELSDSGEIRAACNAFADSLMEMLIDQKADNLKEVSTARNDMEQALPACSETQQMQSLMASFGEKVISAIDTRNKTRRKRYLQAAKEYLENNYANADLSLNMAAEHIGLNASYFSRIFSEDAGQSFTDYLGDLRVAKSCRLLVDTDLLIKDIAYKTGFNSMQNFFRVFKKCRKIPPGVYRQQNRRKA